MDQVLDLTLPQLAFCLRAVLSYRVAALEAVLGPVSKGLGNKKPRGRGIREVPKAQTAEDLQRFFGGAGVRV